MILKKLNTITQEIFETRKTIDKDGNIRTVDDMISREEFEVLYKMFEKASTKKSIEVGLAHGVSALAFCQAHQDAENSIPVDGTYLHYAVDPNQFTDYNAAACTALNKAGFENYYTVLNGPSHMKLPELIENGMQFDCAFIDGWHTFDYTLVDFFLVDKLLKPGGYIAFHDCYGRSKQKVINFILSHRKYEIDKVLMDFVDETTWRVFKFFIWRLYKDPMLLFSWFHWKYQTKHTSGLMVLKKIENFEPPYNFFKNF